MLTLREQVRLHAREEAKKDISFLSPEAFAWVPLDQLDKLREGLIYYADTAAARAYDKLEREKQLKNP